MPLTLAIIAALPRELSLLSRDLRATTVLNANGILVQSTPTSILLVSAGMGSHRAALAVEAALAKGPITTLLSVGLAGACDPALTPATILQPTEIIDSRTGERFEADARFKSTAPLNLAPATLVTTPAIAGPAEKLRLRATYNASAVDMEAATIARIATAHSIPFSALKAISDDYSVDLTSLSRFTSPYGHFRTGAFALHTALRPHLWRSTARLGRHSNAALKALTSATHQLLQKIIQEELSPDHA